MSFRFAATEIDEGVRVIRDVRLYEFESLSFTMEVPLTPEGAGFFARMFDAPARIKRAWTLYGQRRR